jgi:hypothetical protein
MQTSVLAAWVALLIVLPGVARAQAPTAISLGDPDPARWDASGHMSWLAVNKSDIAPEWNRWYDAATVGAAIGRFFGPHLKVEFDAATSASAEVYVEQMAIVPGQPYPIYITQPQHFRLTTLSGGASYQFFDNRWFHPVVGAGIEAARETRAVERVIYPLQLPASVVLDPVGTTATWRGRPFADVGFKWFVSERGFIRSDVRTTFDGNGVSHVSWRSGVGFDF